jgi:hypothetical protein
MTSARDRTADKQPAIATVGSLILMKHRRAMAVSVELTTRY